MTTTSTRTATLTSTYTKIVYVTRKVQTDLLLIQDLYEYFQEDYARDLIHDIRHLLDEEVIDRVKFSWIQPGGSHVLEEFEYKVVSGGLGLADDRPGGIRYRWELSQTDFSVRLTYNNRWYNIEERERVEIRRGLRLNWGPAGQLDYSGGRWLSDRTYSTNDYGLERRRFTR